MVADMVAGPAEVDAARGHPIPTWLKTKRADSRHASLGWSLPIVRVDRQKLNQQEVAGRVRASERCRTCRGVIFGRPGTLEAERRGASVCSPSVTPSDNKRVAWVGGH